MFNLRKKTSRVINSVKQSFEPVRNPQEVIAEIHNEFDTVTDKLLAEAKEILSGIKDVNKGERLKALGFTCSKAAAEAAGEILKRDKNMQIAENIEYFRMYYPNNKFITEEKVAEICKKYRLLLGLAHWYSGDVPEKNLQEIERFKLREEDFFVHTIQKFEHDGKKYVGYSKQDIYGRPNWVSLDTKEPEIKEQEKFKICAPISDFNETYIRNYVTVEDGYKLSPIQDPIVLQPVKGGYLIVSKWGLESEDAELVNERQN